MSGVERLHDHVSDPRRDGGRLRLGPVPDRRRGVRRRAVAVGDRSARPRPGARRVRRPDGDLHRVALRRRRGARRHRRDRVGGTAADERRRRLADAARRPDDVHRRGADGAHQRQRRGRRSPTGDGGDCDASPDFPLPAPDAARVRRARWLAPRADRVAGERDRVGVRRRRRGRPLRLLLVRPAGRPAPRRLDRDRRPARRAPAPRSHAEVDRARPREPRADPRRGVRAHPRSGRAREQGLWGRGGRRPTPLGTRRRDDVSRG